MASVGALSSTTASGFRYYHCCHCQCVFAFTSTPITGVEVSCPFCIRGLLKEYVRAPNLCSPSSSSRTLVFNLRCVNDLDLLEDVVFYFKAFGVIDHDTAWFLLFQSQTRTFQSLLASGATLDIFLPNQIGLCSHELVDIISQDLHNDLHLYTQQHGTLPAAKSVVQALPDYRIEILTSEETHCVVCKDTFHMGMVVKKMPCEHIFHKDCIFRRLELCNSCPVCQFELRTNVAAYDEMRECLRKLHESIAPKIGDSNLEELSGLSLLGNNSPMCGRVEKRRFILHIHQPDAGDGNENSGSIDEAKE